MDYAHARHAGNVGDVVKHLALSVLLRELARDPAPLAYVESHAGDGLYPLGAVGEWGEGIARLWAPAPDRGDLGEVEAYRALVARWSRPGAARPERYPGSPLLAQALLRPQDRLVLHELDPRAAQVLRTALGADARAEVREGDGLRALPAALAGAGRALALVDPPYSSKAEWSQVAAAVLAAHRAAPQAALAVWYPIKAMTRPGALLSALEGGGLHGLAVDVLATPLRLRRDKLNGCGVALFGAPPAALGRLAASLPLLGAAVATRGEWTVRLLGF